MQSENTDKEMVKVLFFFSVRREGLEQNIPHLMLDCSYSTKVQREPALGVTGRHTAVCAGSF